MGKRSHIGNKTKLAAALCALFLTHDEAKALSEDQVLSLVVWDHYPIPHAEDGKDVHYNLTPSLIAPHRKKTAEIDVPGIAKRKRVSKAHQEFVARILTPRAERTVPKSRWGSRSFPKKRKKA